MKKLVIVPVIAGALLAGSLATANASPYPQQEIQVCNVMAQSPNQAGAKYLFDTVLYYVRTGQATTEQYSQIMADAFTNRCPEYWPIVSAYMDSHPAPVQTSKRGLA